MGTDDLGKTGLKGSATAEWAMGHVEGVKLREQGIGIVA